MAVHFEVDGPVAIVTIDRPEVRNALDRPTGRALAEAFLRFEDEDKLAVAVLTGAGGTFCAGADLNTISDGRDDRRAAPGEGRRVRLMRTQLAKPVIAAVEGHAVAGGLELAAWCDMRVAANDAVFGVFCRRWGVPLVDGGTVRLPRLLGHSHALDLILTGRGVSGEEALRMGLANRLVEPGQARAAAVELAHELAAFPQRCLREDRLSSYEQWSLSLGDALRNEHQHGRRVLASGETTAGAARFRAGAGRHGQL